MRIDFRELRFYMRMSALGWIVGIAGLALIGWLELRGAIGSALGFLIGFLWGLFCNQVFPPWQRMIRAGFRWWTVGAVVDRCPCGYKVVLLKLGPVTLTLSRGQSSSFEIHCMNRLRYLKEFRKLAA